MWGVSSNEVVACARILGCSAASFPFPYLGVPIGCNMTQKRNWQPMIDQINIKLSSWKAKTLSFGGHLTLIKLVLDSHPLYYFSLFKAPLSIIDEMEKIRRNFLWIGSEEKSKINWVAWKSVLGPKYVGGLGIGSLFSL